MRLVLIGLVAGFFSALFGVGGGIILVPLLLLYFAFDARSATATSLAAIGITAVSGVIGVCVARRRPRRVCGARRLPAALSVAGATALQQRFEMRTLELLFAAFLLVVAVWLFLE